MRQVHTRATGFSVTTSAYTSSSPFMPLGENLCSTISRVQCRLPRRYSPSPKASQRMTTSTALSRQAHDLVISARRLFNHPEQLFQPSYQPSLNTLQISHPVQDMKGTLYHPAIHIKGDCTIAILMYHWNQVSLPSRTFLFPGVCVLQKSKEHVTHVLLLLCRVLSLTQWNCKT